MMLRSAFLILPGDYVVNIGNVDKVENFPATKLTCLTIQSGIIKSAAFYWYDNMTALLIDQSKQKKVS